MTCQGVKSAAAERPNTSLRELYPESLRELYPVCLREVYPDCLRELYPDCLRGLYPESLRELYPESLRELYPESLRELYPDCLRGLYPESLRELYPDCLRELYPESLRELYPDCLRELYPESLRELYPDCLRELYPESLRELYPESLRELYPAGGCRSAHVAERILWRDGAFSDSCDVSERWRRAVTCAELDVGSEASWTWVNATGNMWGASGDREEAVPHLFSDGLHGSLLDGIGPPELPSMPAMESLLTQDGSDLFRMDADHAIDIDELYAGLQDGSELKQDPPSPESSDSGVDTSPAGFECEDPPARPGLAVCSPHPGPLRRKPAHRGGLAAVSPAAGAATVVAHTYVSRLLKRQERMIKNRMSACLSRKKKKDQFSEMEAHLQRTEADCGRLRAENQQLHRRLAQLQVEVDMLRGLQTPASPPPSPRRPLLLLSVLLIASLNLAPISSLLSGPLPPPFDPSEGDRTAETAPGRTLLWAPADPPTEDTGVSAGEVTRVEDATNSSGGANCSPHVSQLEARRLSKVLRSWFERFHLPTAPGLDPVADRHGYPTFRTAGNTSGRPSRRERWQQAAHPAGRPAAFMEAVQRRDDTFYVVSLSGEQLMLPALKHNETLRPRVSLLLPSAPFNVAARAPERHLDMMQIDFEVVNTRLLHAPEPPVIPAAVAAADAGVRKQPATDLANATSGGARRKLKSEHLSRGGAQRFMRKSDLHKPTGVDRKGKFGIEARHDVYERLLRAHITSA
ncbi:uncharacterized protein LOC119102324 [Pollicipes pollicipes]|uniref:uncharacterized protein LOC119102324 n=1 Tax=Pollicipes pollicipes TaxID=41117 RepID=UPI0018859226|nr:uncharacterized protein LOC119102324 [Pollicipes pollicipes]